MHGMDVGIRLKKKSDAASKVSSLCALSHSLPNGNVGKKAKVRQTQRGYKQKKSSASFHRNADDKVAQKLRAWLMFEFNHLNGMRISFVYRYLCGV
jgi:hypothetical protein